MVISFFEIIYLIIVTLVIGYIFMDIVRVQRVEVFYRKRFDFNAFKFSCLVAAPGIILHELAHKFVAMGFGLTAVFKISAFGLILGAFLKAINSPFILFAPGYVEIPVTTTLPQQTLIAFAGPFINLVLWLGSWLILNTAKKLTRRQAIALYLTKIINMWLFIFNMLPIPPLDGSKVFYGLYNIIFG